MEDETAPVCARCGTARQAGAHFCGTCGAALNDQTAPPPISPAVRVQEAATVPARPRTGPAMWVNDTRSPAAIVAEGRQAWARLDPRVYLGVGVGLVALLLGVLWLHSVAPQRWQDVPLPVYAHQTGGESRTPDGRVSADFLVAKGDASREVVAAWFERQWAVVGYTQVRHITSGRTQVGNVTDEYEFARRGPGAGETRTYLLWVAQDQASPGGTRVSIVAPLAADGASGRKPAWQGPRWQGAPIPPGTALSPYAPSAADRVTLQLVGTGVGPQSLEEWFVATWTGEGYRLIDTSFFGYLYYDWYDPATDRNLTYTIRVNGGNSIIEVGVRPAAASSRTPLALGRTQQWRGLPLPAAAIPDATANATADAQVVLTGAVKYHVVDSSTRDQVARWFDEQWQAAGGTLQITGPGTSGELVMIWKVPDGKTYQVVLSTVNRIVSVLLVP